MRTLLGIVLVLAGCKGEPKAARPGPAPKTDRAVEKPTDEPVARAPEKPAEPRKKPPEKTPEETPEETPPTAEEVLCARGYANVMAVSKAGTTKYQTLKRMTEDKTGFMKRCLAQTEDVRRCLADGTTDVALLKCSELKPGAAKVKADLEPLCREALTRSIGLFEREGAPAEAMQRMRDREEEAVRECMREDEALVRCLLEAQHVPALRTCKLRAKGIPEDAAHEQKCKLAFERMMKVVRPGIDMPKVAVESLRSQFDKFVIGCQGSRVAVAECMATAADFAAFKQCATFPEGTEPKERPKPGP